MTALTARGGWPQMLRGAVAVLFGLALLLWPQITLVALLVLFAGYVLVQGMLALVAAVNAAEQRQPWARLMAEGAVAIAIGLITIFWPGVTGMVLLYLIALWALAVGVTEALAAFRSPDAPRRWLHAAAAVLSLLLSGSLLVVGTTAGVGAMAWLIGVYAIVYGGILIALLVWRSPPQAREGLREAA
ncbi:MAG: DUF308 domain-containing protein [Chloroflexi bacterium]|nr:DUF308 domain-containing protein [Chloroflexota bacterium]